MSLLAISLSVQVINSRVGLESLVLDLVNYLTFTVAVNFQASLDLLIAYLPTQTHRCQCCYFMFNLRNELDMFKFLLCKVLKSEQ